MRGRKMLRPMLKVAAATAVYGLVHSALASRAAKNFATAAIGERNRNGLYRTFFIAQSLGTFALLTAYIRRQPSKELYHVRGPAAVLMHAGQAAAAGYAVAAARQVGIRRIVGWESLAAWCGEGAVPPEPEAQGPALDEEGPSRAAGPFARSRHPLNFVPVPIFWLWPRMTTNLLAFNAAATVYLVLGSRHEEARLLHAYGERYAAYQQSGVPFYAPRPTRAVPAEPTAALAGPQRPNAD